MAAVLEYQYPKDAVKAHCKYQELLKEDASSPLTDSPRGINVIPESDVFRLIMRSNPPAAEKFQDWGGNNNYGLKRTIGFKGQF